MGRIAYVFPGQGAQKAGMGRDFYENSPAAANVFERAGDILSLDMKALCFEQNERLDITEYTQAAMVTTSLSMLAAMKDRGLREPDVTAGLSLGEYCAMAAAGVMSGEDAIKTVRRRGILMQEAVPAGQGAMAAVLSMKAEDIEHILENMEEVQIANYNCPGQTVISGKAEAVDRACAALQEAGARRTVKLNVSGPFHSSLLREAGEKLYEALAPVKLMEHEIPYVSNVTAEYVTGTDSVKDYLKRQVFSPVKWQQSVETMLSSGVDTFVEIGPGKTLSSFIKKISRDAVVYNVEIWEDLDTLEAVLGRN
ncbi:ACP S-malonyltransferase [Lacrimispora sp. NSJ-141]|uniref:Malonyl CoA-acyl carrier protein transacylase n=1 Tax=Lientehia hominis TaxID=2897778 RepID=A0AAP2WAN3_9FIRM|nr:ACP S-malonyltransferase [Lientehia hominis]MCD2493539.1 ACP S-malonyltransferase [Lientehia hominis]